MSLHCPTCGASDDGTVNGWVHRARMAEDKFDSLERQIADLVTRLHDVTEERNEWIARFNKLPAIVANAEERGHLADAFESHNAMMTVMKRAERAEADRDVAYGALEEVAKRGPEAHGMTPHEYAQHFLDMMAGIVASRP